MNKILHTMIILGLVLLQGLSCSKVEKEHEEGSLNLGGVLYYRQAGEGTLKFDLSTRKKSILLPVDIQQNGFFVNKTQDKVLILSDIQGDHDNELFRVESILDGSLISEITVDKGTHSGYIHPQLSPDGKYVLANSLLPDNVIVIEMATRLVYFLNDIGEDHNKIIDAIWMQDGNVLLATEKGIYRSSIPFDELQEVKKLSKISKGSLAVRADGGKIVFKAEKHLWMMNADGNELQQITDSNSEEGVPTFSPNGKYLLLGIKEFAGGVGTWGGYYSMCVIPADGKKYLIEEGEGNSKVTLIKAANEAQAESFNERVQWLK